MERLRWRLRLWAERTYARLLFTHRMIDMNAGSAIKGSTFDDLVDRVSPWVNYRGYQRARLRRWLYRLRHARRNFIQTLRGWTMSALSSWAPHPGRYEGNTSQLIAEWLDTNAYISDEELGSIDEYYSFFTLATGEFPWGTGYYITQTTDQGFFSVSEYETLEGAMTRWAAIRQQYEFWMSQDDPDRNEPDFENDLVYSGVLDEPMSESELRFQHGDK